MRINDSSGSGRIEIEQLVDVSPMLFAVSVELEGRRVSYDDISFTNLESFIEELERYFELRTGEAYLDGGPAFSMRISAHGVTGDASVVLRIVDRFALPMNTSAFGNLTLECGFVLSGEWVGRLVEDFRSIKNSAQ